MSKKRNELEALLDQLRKWAVEYDEPYVTMCVINKRGKDNIAMAHIDVGRPDAEDMFIRIDNDAPTGATARASK